jgi:hypothetical protein
MTNGAITCYKLPPVECCARGSRIPRSAPRSHWEIFEVFIITIAIIILQLKIIVCTLRRTGLKRVA